LQDYRASSYKSRAKKISDSRSGFSYTQSNTAKSSGLIGASAGDVLIYEGSKEEKEKAALKGEAASGVSFSSGGGGSNPSARITPETTPTNKIEGANPSAIITPKNVDINKNFAYLTSPISLNIQEYQPRSKNGWSDIYYASPIYPIVLGFQGLFTKPLPYTWSDNPDDQKKLELQKQRIEAAQELLPTIYVLGETVIKPKIMIQPKNIDINLRSAVRIASSDKEILTKANIIGTAKVETRGLFGLFSRTKTYSIVGTGEEYGIVTNELGTISIQPIIKTEGYSRFTLAKGKKINNIVLII
jgi:hypothetical protein